LNWIICRCSVFFSSDRIASEIGGILITHWTFCFSSLLLNHTYINNSILSFFFYAIFRFVATHCCTPMILRMCTCLFFSTHFAYIYLCVCVYVFLFTCNYIIFVLFVLFLVFMQRYRCLYVAVQQWSTIFNTQIKSFLLDCQCFFLRVEQAIFSLLSSSSFSKWIDFMSPLCSFSFVLSFLFFLHYRQHTQSVCVCVRGNLFCCYYIEEKWTKKIIKISKITDCFNLTDSKKMHFFCNNYFSSMI
jgi:hypothetical protein